MRYPAFLKENGTIGFVAPSFGCASGSYRAAFDNGLKKLRERGFQVWLGPNCYKEEGIGISAAPKECGKELTEGYLSAENDCLISCGGGELMCEILEYVDFEAVKQASPKWYMGYSDNTNMTFLLATLCDTASVYGPGAAGFGMEPWHSSLEDALAILMGKKKEIKSYGLWEREKQKDEEHPLLPYNCTEKLEIKAFVPDAKGQLRQMPMAQLSGRLLGGCMDCLVNLTGTCYDKVKEFGERYKKDGILWFLESCDLNVFGIRRAMWQMEQAGWFEHVKGFLIGRPLCHGQEMMGLDQYEAVLPYARRHQVPVIMDADLGHLPPMMPLITGSMANVTAEGNNLTVSMELV